MGIFLLGCFTMTRPDVSEWTNGPGIGDVVEYLELLGLAILQTFGDGGTGDTCLVED